MTRTRLFGRMALIAVLVASAVVIAGGERPKIKQVQASIVYTFAEVARGALAGRRAAAHRVDWLNR